MLALCVPWSLFSTMKFVEAVFWCSSSAPAMAAGKGEAANVLLVVPHSQGHLKWFCSSLVGTWQPRTNCNKGEWGEEKGLSLEDVGDTAMAVTSEVFSQKTIFPFSLLSRPQCSEGRGNSGCCQLDPEVPSFQLGQANANSGKTYPRYWIFTFAFLKPKLNFYLVWVMIQKIKYARITVVKESSRNGFLAQTYASHISLEVISHGNLTSEGHWS